ncbi:MAG: hypothetical protein KBB57_16815 [Amaricoccus sp.]|nr:hypothetical protein [Amaricoccus sp.]
MHPLAGRFATPAPRRVAPLAGPAAPAAITPFGPAAAAIAFDTPAGSPRGRLSAWIDDAPLVGRSAATSLALRGGGLRHVLLVGRPAPTLARQRIDLELGGRPAAAIDPDWLESPLAEPAALLDGLADDGRRRLLRLALTAGATLLGPAAAEGAGALATRLLDALDAPALSAVAWAPLGASGGVATWRAPRDLTEESLGEVVLLAPLAGRRAAGAGLAIEATRAGRLLHLHLSRPLPAGAVVAGLGPRPLRLVAPGPDAARPLARWLDGRSAPARAWALALLEAAAAADPTAAALVRELRCAGSAPRLTLTLAGTPGGLLIGHRLHDPHGLAAAIRIERGDGPALDLPASPAGASFVPAPRRSAVEDRARVRIVLGSGRATTVWTGAVPAFRGPAPRDFGAGRPDEAAAALAAARLGIERAPLRVAVARIGATRGQPRLSIVAPADGGRDLLRARAAMVAAEPGAAGVEIVLHAAGDAAEAARAAASEAAAVHGVAHRIVATPTAADLAERTLAALAAAEGAAILLLGAEVLPEGPGWLAPWLRGATPALVGATLLDHDGAVLDAGGTLRGPRIERTLTGLPALDLPRRKARPTDWLTAECAGLTAAAARALVEAGPRHPNPDVLLGALAAALGAARARVATRLDRRFVRYAPAAPRGLDAAADDLALVALVKGSFSPAAEEGACAR